MIYKDFCGKKLSALGLGCMRLPKNGPKDSDIDVNAVAAMAETALKNGINYFDVAYGYHAGNAENVIGEVLSAYPRDSFYLADKFPGYDVSNFGHEEELFEEQLKKCKTDYFDFYLLHNVCEMNIEQYMSDNFPLRYFLTQKENGRIKHLGFSCHGKPETHERFLERFGPYMEFCQIELNWLDWNLQKAKEKVRGLNEKNIPIWVMEPVRGGMLAKLDDKNEKKLQELIPGVTAVEADFRFIQSVPGVCVTLSGMSNMEQLKQNIEIFSEEKKLSEEQFDGLISIGNDLASVGTIPCTGCRYCTGYCPQEIDIPNVIGTYNDHVITGGGFRSPQYLGGLPKSKWPQSCLHCGACAAVCPQKIDIPSVMEDYSERLSKDELFLRITGGY
ncbi:MAG: aldo/keto reductase [Lachnospiraceae bacterium]|nr:aldo/keto reductase [Lachnospiraceae bacterium]